MFTPSAGLVWPSQFLPSLPLTSLATSVNRTLRLLKNRPGGRSVTFFLVLPFAGEYYAGFLTEKALSLDNLFVFIIIMSSFRVPRNYQQKALLSGIIIALVLRLVFILVGAALIERFTWVFFIFGAWLLWTAFSQAREGIGGEDEHEDEE